MKMSELELEMDDLWRLVRLAENEADHYDDDEEVYETYIVLAEKLRKIIMKGGVRYVRQCEDAVFEGEGT